MKVEYDTQTDTLTITLRDARIRDSDDSRGVPPSSAGSWLSPASSREVLRHCRASGSAALLVNG